MKRRGISWGSAKPIGCNGAKRFGGGAERRCCAGECFRQGNTSEAVIEVLTSGFASGRRARRRANRDTMMRTVLLSRLAGVAETDPNCRRGHPAKGILPLRL